MIIRALGAIMLISALGGCDRFDNLTGNDVSAENSTPENIGQPVEDAMKQIPPELRISYHQAFSCEVKNSVAKGNGPIQITPDYVEGLLGRLQANPNITKC